MVRIKEYLLLVLVLASAIGFAACEKPQLDDQDEDGANPVASVDPNEISGPAGAGELRYVRRGQKLEYTIYFENKTNATAAAQEIRITLPEDPNLDWNTLEFGEISIPKVSNGLTMKSETSRKDGSVRWYLRAWDATTPDHWPDDQTAGILPPNDPATHCGEGYVKYSVAVKPDAVAGARIAAEATIVFDTNAPIKTDPSWWNTVGLDITIVPFADGIGYLGPYDGEEHGIDVAVTTPTSGYTVKYCDVEFGEYTTTPVKYRDVGTNTVWFTVEAENYVPYRGSAKVIVTDSADAPKAIEPGETSGNWDTREAAAAAANRLYVAFPKDIKSIATASEQTVYTNLFRIVQHQNPGTGKWFNAVEFTPEAVASLTSALDAAVRGFDLSRITEGDTDWLVPNPIKGLYYVLERTDSLSSGFSEHRSELATEVSVTFTVNEEGRSQGFFRLAVRACP